jgi:demethylmenaquinone methyltransferase / 2-methoxy-6-polyprenyl-1,4-benzoquinol methylase
MTSMNYDEVNPSRPGGPEMFDRIAKRYDRLNRVLSFGLDRRWRRNLVNSMAPIEAGDVLLDLATGTADVALSLARAYPEATIIGLDPSEGMLEVGVQKVARADLAERIKLVVGDARALPFDDDHVRGITIAFGIRNVPDRDLALREMVRVTQPGGAVSVLELAEPTQGPFAALARTHVHHIVPRIGRMVAGTEAYRYLQESIAAFPPAEDFRQQMERAGLVDVTAEAQTFATATLYTGRAPEKD